ncbi:MAG: YsnF/AvaK domain-containing protein [Planctomycetes bacterium]|nr:YsnF/AvaK domain-containing protein [Planctomycetota bacterium]
MEQPDRDDTRREEQVLPLAREELRLETRRVPTARLVVRTRVETREEEVAPPLAREAFDVERVEVNRYVDAPPPVRQEGDTTIVPVVEEVLVVEKRLLLREEVRLVRRIARERRPQRVTLRAQRVEVERIELPAPAGDDRPPGPHPTRGGGEIVMTSDRYCIIGLFQRREDAMAARQDLLDMGHLASDIQLSDAPQKKGARREPGFWTQLKELFGAEDVTRYDQASRRGLLLLRVDSDAHKVDTVVDILQRHGAVDLEEEAPAGGQARTAATATGATEQEKIPIIEEQLDVGTRREVRGGVRIYSRVIEEPVQEEVTLREEHVDVQRRPADRPATEADFQERVVEAMETREEPVVRKEARVVEEVVLSKDIDERKETIQDTLRKIEVDVQDLEVEFQKDFQDRYASSGASYDQYRPAYDFGRRLALRETSHGDFESIEPEARDEFERQHPGQWSTYRDAVRRGYERSLARR